MHGVVTTMTNRPPAAPPRPRMTSEAGVRFGIANALLLATFLVTATVHLDPTLTAWAGGATAGLLGIGPSVARAAGLGAISWAWFTGFFENRYGELSFAGDDLQRLVAFTLAAVAIAALGHHTHHVIKENARG